MSCGYVTNYTLVRELKTKSQVTEVIEQDEVIFPQHQMGTVGGNTWSLPYDSERKQEIKVSICFNF